MNIGAVKLYILEELAHGKPIQVILNPSPSTISVVDPETGEVSLIKDPDWVKPDLPDWNLVVSWLGKDEAFRQEWDTARKYGASYQADEMLLLKDRLLKDPKNANAYKVAMDMIKTSAMWGDPKYSERTIKDVVTTAPKDSEAVLSRISQLEKELGIKTIDVEVVEVKKKERTPAQLAHYQKMVKAKEEAKAKRDAKKRGLNE